MADKIFLVDDTTILAESISDALLMEGYIVRVFANALQALARLEIEIPSLIITDMIMPEMNGLEFISRLRRVERLKMLPVIVITADTKGENEINARQAGADLLLHKPFDYEELIAAIKKLLS